MTVIVVDEAKLGNNKILRLEKGDITEKDVDECTDRFVVDKHLVKEIFVDETL
jgi:hypothetical protein